MTFFNVYQLLKWFFRQRWLRPPKTPGNHSMVYVQHSRMPSDPQEDFETYQKIREALKTLSLPDLTLIRLLFTEMTTDEAAIHFNVTERRIRQRRFEILRRLSRPLGEVGLFGVPVYEKPILEREANETDQV